MPGGVTGREVRFAFAKTGTNSWGVAASVTMGAFFRSDGGLKLEPNIVEDDAFGQTFIQQADVGNITAPSLDLEAQARYNDYTYVLEALAMGSPAAATIATSASGQVTSWQHVIDLAPHINGLAFTGAFDMVQYVKELTSAKVTGWTLSDGDGGVMMQTFKVLGSKPTITSSVNINSTVADATYPTLANRVFKRQGVFRMNVNSGSSLGAGDKVDAQQIEFTFSRDQDAPHVYGQDYVVEPADNAYPEFQFKVTYPRMNTVAANSLFVGLAAQTAFKADWTFTGALINSTDAYTLKYQFPYVQLVDHEATVTGANQVKPTATFRARMATTSPSGMPFVNPFRMTRITTNSVVAF